MGAAWDCSSLLIVLTAAAVLRTRSSTNWAESSSGTYSTSVAEALTMPSLRRLRLIQAAQLYPNCGGSGSSDTVPIVNDDSEGNSEENHVDLDDIAKYASSLERFAEAVKLTVEEVVAIRETYETAATALHRNLQDPNLSGHLKHQLHCRHRLEHGRQPFVCSTCWSYLPICLCKKDYSTEHQAISLEISGPANTTVSCLVILWTHHKEWGTPSNTGSVLTVAMGGDKCQMLMKGLDEHDAVLQQILQQQSHALNEIVFPVLLWTDKDGDDENKANGSNSQRQSVTIEQLNEELLEAAVHSETSTEVSVNLSIRLVVIAVEGTWGHARRMVTKLPTTLRALQLSEHEIFGWRSHGVQRSLLHPLRKQKKIQVFKKDDATTRAATATGIVFNTHKVCTVEAVVSALVAVAALTIPQAESILALAEQKVNRTIQYQGKLGRPMAGGWTND